MTVTYANDSAVSDPPASTRTMPLREATQSEYLTRLIAAELMAFVAFIGAMLCWRADIKIGTVILGLIALLLAYVGFSAHGRIAHCVYCNEKIGEVNEKEAGQRLRCPKCGEYNQLMGGSVLALDPKITADKPLFESVMFKDAAIPLACAVCGEPPARLDEVSASRNNKGAATALLVGTALAGRPTLYYNSKKASMQVPYCDKHKDGVTIRYAGSKPMIVWKSHRMLRRYLAANSGKQAY